MALNSFASITGDCSNTGSGAISLFVDGGTPPYTQQWISPFVNTFFDQNPVLVENLGSAEYYIRINDSTLPVNQEIYVNIPVSNGVCASIVQVNNTTCGLNNGSVTATTTSLYSSTNYYLYDNNDNLVISAITNTNLAVFESLSAGTYYFTVQDLGGCTAKTQNFIVEPSVEFDFGFYTVQNSPCGIDPIGKIFVTGQTGVPPYNYIWSNGQSGSSSITGLSEGTYSCTVTDSLGCVVAKSTTIVNVPPVGLVGFTSTPPTCLSNNGEVTIEISGGTGPYYYSASTGQVLISYSQSFTLTNIFAGLYAFKVTDAGLCNFEASVYVASPTGIDSVQVTTQNSNCSASDGSITVNVVGGTAPYTYTLIRSGGNTNIITSSNTLYTFNNLPSGDYTIFVEDANNCSVSENVTIIAENLFQVTLSVTGTTCNLPNGTIKVDVSGDYSLPLTYFLDFAFGDEQLPSTNLTSFSFNNVSSGSHTVTVIDNNGCSIVTPIEVGTSSPMIFSLYGVSCGSGNDGSITAFITSGVPPFSFNWSDNVPGNPQSIQANNLSGGTYTLRITDSNGCSLQNSINITCNSNYKSYQTYSMGEQEFTIQSPTKCGLLQMLNQGYIDLTMGETNCTLNSAIFTAKLKINPLGYVRTLEFFTTDSLIKPPADNDWYNAVRTILLATPGILNVNINELSNEITIQTLPGDSELNGQEIILELLINYDITCIQ